VLVTARITYVGDIVVAIYLMVPPSLALILAAAASGSPHALGREPR
jgi:hypothetical protein